MRVSPQKKMLRTKLDLLLVCMQVIELYQATVSRKGAKEIGLRNSDSSDGGGNAGWKEAFKFGSEVGLCVVLAVCEQASVFLFCLLPVKLTPCCFSPLQAEAAEWMRELSLLCGYVGSA